MSDTLLQFQFYREDPLCKLQEPCNISLKKQTPSQCGLLAIKEQQTQGFVRRCMSKEQIWHLGVGTILKVCREKLKKKKQQLPFNSLSIGQQ